MATASRDYGVWRPPVEWHHILDRIQTDWMHPSPTKHWVVPAPSAVAEVHTDDGTTIHIRRHGNPSGPRVLMTHGNGLAIDLYYPFWSLLADRFDLLIYDLRSHGWNPVGDLSSQSFPKLVSDNREVIRVIAKEFGEKPMIGLYHSVSALVGLWDELRGAAGFSALMLYDLPICPPGGAPEDLEAILGRVATRTRKRQDRFESRKHFVESLRASRSFERMGPGLVELFAETTLRQSSDGSYELSCPIEHEAVIYEYGFGWSMQTQQALEQVPLKCPVKVVGSDPTVPYSFLPAMDLKTLTMLDYDFLPETTHFLQLEQPEDCANAMTEFLEESGLL